MEKKKIAILSIIRYRDLIFAILLYRDLISDNILSAETRLLKLRYLKNCCVVVVTLSASAVPPPTFGGHEGLVVLGAPAHWVQLGRHDVAPEVGFAVVAVAAVAQQQQLAAGGDDGGHPVGVAAALVGHLQLHAGLEAALQAGLHLMGGGHATEH